MICVLDVTEGPARGKRIWLKENQCIEIGRISTADFSIPADTHLSRRHLLLDSTQNGFRIRDVGSSNGTFLNDVRISVEELKSGDTVRAGLSTFYVTLCQDGENPHAKDGLSFSRPMPTSIPAEPSILDTELQEESVTKFEEAKASDFEKGTSYRTLDFSDRLDLESTVRIKCDEPDDSENSGLNQVNRNWWRAFFSASEVESIYEQTSPFSSPHGNFVGLIQEFETEFELALIVNVSQLPNRGHELMAKISLSGTMIQLSRSLCFLKYEKTKDIQKLVSISEGEDAIICIGTRRALPREVWEKHANSLSYPSMFISHLKNPESKLRETLLGTGSFSLFERNRDGDIVLLIRDNDD